jgi:hypothetical protein
MPQRQLNIRSDEAAERAGVLAKRLGKTTTEVVVEALRSYEQTVATPHDDRGMTPQQRRRFDRLMALSAETAKHLIPGSPADHDWLYDENGLPR